MKKTYFLVFAMIGFIVNAQVLIDDDMESYALGPLHQAHWSSWSGNSGTEDIIVVDTHANSGTQSGFMDAGPGPQDVILLLGSHTSGLLSLDFMMYVPAGKSAYYNFQESVPAGANWALHVQFNETETSPGVGSFQSNNTADPVAGSFTYPEDTWFLLSHEIDINNNTVVIELDGTEIYNGDLFAETGEIAAVDFFGANANNEYYIDDVYLEETLATNDFSKTAFEIYPNPIDDKLNIRSEGKISQVEIYSILGKRIMSVHPENISPEINVGHLSTGAYLVKITGEKGSETIKVIK